MNFNGLPETASSNTMPESPAQPGASGPQRAEPPAARKLAILSQGNIVLIAMFLGAIGGLYALSRWRGPDKASAETRTAELQVDNALMRLGIDTKTDSPTSVKSVVDAFYCQAKQRQVPVDQLVRDPFLYQPPPTSAAVVPTVAKSPTAKQVEAAKEMEDALRDVRTLRLQSVLVGQRQNSAIISNNLLTVGQEIQGWTVVDIGPRRVVLKYLDRRHELSLPE